MDINSNETDTEKVEMYSEAPITKEMRTKLDQKKQRSFVAKFFFYGAQKDYFAHWFPVNSVVGVGWGFFLWWWFFAAITKDESKSFVGVFRATFITAISVTYAGFLKTRAVLWLSLPTMLGAESMTVFTIFMTQSLMSGPVMNSASNIQAMVECMQCNLDVMREISKAQSTQMKGPMREIAINMFSGSFQIREMQRAIDEMLSPFTDDLKNLSSSEQHYVNMRGKVRQRIDKIAMPDASSSEELDPGTNTFDKNFDKNTVAPTKKKKRGKKVKLTTTESPMSRIDWYKSLTSQWAKQYLLKLKYKCKKNALSVSDACHVIAGEAYAGCVKRILKSESRNSLMFRLVRLFCKAIIPVQMCNMDQLKAKKMVDTCMNDTKIKNEIESFEGLIDGAIEMSLNLNKMFKVVARFKIEMTPPEVMTLPQLTGLIRVRFESFHMVMGIGLKFMKQILKLITLLVIYRSYKFVKAYLTDIEAENNILTPYFYRLDESRVREGREFLLPLRKIEKKDLQGKMTKLGPTKSELNMVKKLARRMVVYTMGMIALIKFDDFIVKIARKILAPPTIEHSIKIERNVAVRVDGEGFLAKWVSNMLGAFNKTESIDKTFDNRHCASIVKEVSPEDYVQIWQVYAITLLCIVFRGYLIRSRVLLTIVLFRRRYKTRVVWLYNSLLKKRAKFTTFLNRDLKENFREHIREYKLKLTFFKKHKDKFWMKLIAKVECLVCKDRANSEKMISCPDTANCQFFYCSPCWIDMKEKCMGCILLREQWEQHRKHKEEKEKMKHQKGKSNKGQNKSNKSNKKGGQKNGPTTAKKLPSSKVVDQKKIPMAKKKLINKTGKNPTQMKIQTGKKKLPNKDDKNNKRQITKKKLER